MTLPAESDACLAGMDGRAKRAATELDLICIDARSAGMAGRGYFTLSDIVLFGVILICILWSAGVVPVWVYGQMVKFFPILLIALGVAVAARVTLPLPEPAGERRAE